MQIRGLAVHFVCFQLSVKSDSIPLSDICVKSAKCHTGFRSSDSNLIINVHCSGESASQTANISATCSFLTIHSDGAFHVLAGVLPQSFCAGCHMFVTFDP